MAETLFDHSTMGTPSAVGDDGPVTLGTIFRVLEKGYITQLYFYKDTTDTEDSHTVLLYDYTGEVLTSQTTSGDSAKDAGWIAVPLDDVVVVDAGMEYMTATYYPSVYSVTASYLTADMSNGAHLLVPNDANLLYFNTENGQFSYGEDPTFPIDAGHEAYYWTDVEYVKDLIVPLDISTGIPTVGVPSITIGGMITLTPTDLTANKPYFSYPSIVEYSGADFTDTFTASNTNLEDTTDWTSDGLIDGALKIVSNAVDSATTDEVGSAYFSPDLGKYDNYVAYTVVDGVDATGSFVCTRLVDAKHWIGIRHDPVSMRAEIYFRNGDTFTEDYLLYTDSEDDAVVIDDVIGLVVQGNFWQYVKIVDDALVFVSSGIIPENMPKTTRQGIVGREALSSPFITDFYAAVSKVNSTVSVTEDDDTLSVESTVYTTGVLSLTEDDDTLSSEASASTNGRTTYTEDDDTLSSETQIKIAATVSFTEDDDVLDGFFAHQFSGEVDITEEDDFIGSFVGKLPYKRTSGNTGLPYKRDY